MEHTEEEREESYRRGYFTGYMAAMKDPSKLEEVEKWARGDLSVYDCPPGSPFPGRKLGK